MRNSSFPLKLGETQADDKSSVGSYAPDMPQPGAQGLRPVGVHASRQSATMLSQVGTSFRQSSSTIMSSVSRRGMHGMRPNASAASIDPRQARRGSGIEGKTNFAPSHSGSSQFMTGRYRETIKEFPAWLDLVLRKPKKYSVARGNRNSHSFHPDLWSTPGIAAAHRRYGFQSELPSRLWIQHFVKKSRAMNRAPCILRTEMETTKLRDLQRRASYQDMHIAMTSAGGIHHGSSWATSSSRQNGALPMVGPPEMSGMAHNADMLANARDASTSEDARAATTADVLRNALRWYPRAKVLIPNPAEVLQAAKDLTRTPRRPSDEIRTAPSNRMLAWVEESSSAGGGGSDAHRPTNRTTASKRTASPPHPKIGTAASKKDHLAAMRRAGWRVGAMQAVKNALTGQARWRRKFYLRDVAATLSQATMYSVQRKATITNHVIIAGSVTNLLFIVRSLRSRVLDECRPIVLLHHSPPVEAEWRVLSLFQDVYFVQGSPLHREALTRAGIQKASCAIVLSGLENGVAAAQSTDMLAHAGAPVDGWSVGEGPN